MADIVGKLVTGAVIGVAAWGVGLIAGSVFAGLGAFASIATVAVGYVAADMAGVV